MCGKIQVGIVSRGYGCGQKGGGAAFTRVYYFMSWITKHAHHPDIPPFNSNYEEDDEEDGAGSLKAYHSLFLTVTLMCFQ